MSRTYWKQTGENAFEFLGAFGDGHIFDPKRPRDLQFVGAGVLDINGHSIADTMAALNDRVILSDMPAKMRNRLAVKDGSVGTVVEWFQIEGFLK